MLGGLLTRITGWLNPRRFGRSVSSSDLVATPVNGSVSAALQATAVWACCRLLSQSTATLPGHVLQTTASGRERATTHSLWRLLTMQPNPLMTLPQWLQTTVLHLMLYGNAYTWPVKSADGQIEALWPLLPERVSIVTDAAGNYVYRVSDPGGKPRDLLPLELLHFRVFSLDGIVGLSPIEYHRLSVSLDAASRMYAINLYSNGGRPMGVLEYPHTLKAEQFASIRDSWRAVHSGPANAGSIVILDGGTKYQALALPPEQMEFISQQKFSVEQIARIYGVPPHLIGAMDKPTYASVEQQALEYLQYTLQPIVTSIEKTIGSVLLEPPFFYKLNLSSFERSDIRTRYGAYATGRQWGFLSVNDIRELEDLNGIGADGDIYLQPLNMVRATDSKESLDGNQSVPVA